MGCWCVVSEFRVRLSRKNTLYIPKSVAEAVGIREGSVLRLRVEGFKIIVEPVPDPFDLALKGSKFAKVSFEEFERVSEEVQNELFGEDENTA
ncbi:MAG: AbrB family transcriptional regulator [Desulfurococcales archaeon ex4484_217_2]|nr:MAG: AbrB family transcriptional regulator [Desulfurococcales archaeon ex4484_217_2]